MKLSDKVHDYISDTMNYDMDELLERLVENIPEMKFDGKHTASLDECAVVWGDDYLMDLDDYTKQVFKEAVKRIVNVVRSFESDEENGVC